MTAPLNPQQFPTGNKLPTHAIFGKVGKVRITSYAGNGFFHVVDSQDNKRFTHRKNLTFLP